MLLQIPAALFIVAGIAMMIFRFRQELLVLFNQADHRVDVIGEAADVLADPTQSQSRDYFDQLRDLGFAPLGIVREVLPGYTGEAEHVLFHPQLQCRAIVYALGGGDPRVCLKSDFDDGRFVATYNYGYDEMQQTTPHLIDRREPTHSMQQLLDTHIHARFDWAQKSGQLVDVPTVEEAARIEEGNFRNPTIARQFRRNNLTIIGRGAVWELLIAALIARGSQFGVERTFGLALFGIAAFDTIWAIISYRLTLQQLTGEQTANDQQRQQSTTAADSLPAG